MTPRYASFSILSVSRQKIIFARDDNTEIMMKRFLTAVLLLFPLLISAQVRTERFLETGWMFTREDSQQFAHPDYDDSGWQAVRIPHDWAIYGLPARSADHCRSDKK